MERSIYLTDWDNVTVAKYIIRLSLFNSFVQIQLLFSDNRMTGLDCDSNVSVNIAIHLAVYFCRMIISCYAYYHFAHGSTAFKIIVYPLLSKINIQKCVNFRTVVALTGVYRI